MTTRLKNTTDKVLSAMEMGSNKNFLWTAKDRDGKVVPLTRFGRSQLALMALNFIPIRPGQTVEHTVLVTRFVDLSESGDYAISATSILPNPNFGPKDRAIDVVGLVSNTLQLKIVESDRMPH